MRGNLSAWEEAFQEIYAFEMRSKTHKKSLHLSEITVVHRSAHVSTITMSKGPGLTSRARYIKQPWERNMQQHNRRRARELRGVGRWWAKGGVSWLTDTLSKWICAIEHRILVPRQSRQNALRLKNNRAREMRFHSAFPLLALICYRH